MPRTRGAGVSLADVIDQRRTGSGSRIPSADIGLPSVERKSWQMKSKTRV
jgi:hypothetical protein